MHAIKTEFGSLTHHELANLQKNSAYLLASYYESKLGIISEIDGTAHVPWFVHSI